ncbi:MAG: GxxExxY protein [Acidobacteriota bacterium]
MDFFQIAPRFGNIINKTRIESMEFEELTETIIGSAFQVYNKMGFGFLESVYERCMQIELEKAGLKVEAQKSILVRYDEHVVGEFTADLLVESKIVVELKSVSRLVETHEVQLVNYLVATGIPVGLLLNFGEKKVEV